MSSSSKQESAAIDAVARHFSAASPSGRGGSPGPYLMIDGKRIAVQVVVSREKGLARHAGTTKPRLRFDRVALRLISDLQVALRDSVPEGRAMVITVTAPIRQSSKTVVMLANEIRGRLARRTAWVELNGTINGNQVTARLVKDASRRASRVIVFVHNPDPGHVELLVSLTDSLLRHIGAAGDRRAPKKSAGDAWLVLACRHGPLHAETYRHIYSQLAMATDFQKVLLVLAGGRVEPLAG